MLIRSCLIRKLKLSMTRKLLKNHMQTIKTIVILIRNRLTSSMSTQKDLIIMLTFGNLKKIYNKNKKREKDVNSKNRLNKCRSISLSSSVNTLKHVKIIRKDKKRRKVMSIRKINKNKILKE